MHSKLVFLMFVIICTGNAALGATCTPGYYPENGTCTICPKYYACPDGDNKIYCINENPAQYTDVPNGATECKNCPPPIHQDGFVKILHYRGSEGDYSVSSCRACYSMQSTHGNISFSCSYNASMAALQAVVWSILFRVMPDMFHL